METNSQMILFEFHIQMEILLICVFPIANEVYGRCDMYTFL